MRRLCLYLLPCAFGLNELAVYRAAAHGDTFMVMLAAVTAAVVSFAFGAQLSALRHQAILQELLERLKGILEGMSSGPPQGLTVTVEPGEDGLVALVSLGDDVHMIRLPEGYHPDQDGGHLLARLVTEWFVTRSGGGSETPSGGSAPEADS